MSEPNDEPQTDELEDNELEDEPAHIDGEPDPATVEAAERDGSRELIDKSEKANKNYTKRLREIWGSDTTLYDCPSCNGLGVLFTEPAAPLETLDVLQAEDTAPCAKCNAMGLTLTGSKQPGYETKPCLACAGRGYTEKPQALATVTPYVPVEQPAEQPVNGQYVPGKGFVPYGATEPLPGTLMGA